MDVERLMARHTIRGQVRHWSQRLTSRPCQPTRSLHGIDRFAVYASKRANEKRGGAFHGTPSRRASPTAKKKNATLSRLLNHEKAGVHPSKFGKRRHKSTSVKPLSATGTSTRTTPSRGRLETRASRSIRFGLFSKRHWNSKPYNVQSLCFVGDRGLGRVGRCQHARTKPCWGNAGVFSIGIREEE